jgi:Astacin (Peptidase family M12A)
MCRSCISKRAFLRGIGFVACSSAIKVPSEFAYADEQEPLLEYCAVIYPDDNEEAEALSIVASENAGILLSSTEAAALRVDPKWGRWNPKRIEKGIPLRVGFMQPNHTMNDFVVAAGHEWEKYMGLRFDFTATDEFDVLVNQDAAGNNSKAGVASRQAAMKGLPSVNIQKFTPGHLDSQRLGIALHELGHSLGLIHEHQNPNADLDFDEKAVVEYYEAKYGWDEKKTRKNVLTPLSADLATDRTNFDPDSIMIYELPGVLFEDGRVNFSKNYTLSNNDKKLIGRIYPKLP